MVITQDRSLRKPSGSRNTGTRPRRLSRKGNNPVNTGIGKRRAKVKKGRGGTKKISLLATEKVNLFDPKTKKHMKASIKAVKENSSNRNYVRRNIITKGAIIETDKGLAVVTSRPGQHGTLNVVLKE